jgi:SPP1 family predicted phage head-tail adaptor
MAFGELDRRVIIQQGTETVGANGERSVVWSTFVTLWAGIDYGTGGEDYEAGQRTASNEVNFVVRYYPGITEKMRVSYDSASYDILHISEVGRQRYLMLKSVKVD